ncbi:MAG TPA: ArsR family transcriptional regulator [Ilumatobacteraceae bacterium]|nr:ArsR family transcriptional regulator [Ilumatobacteraceae bacterium]
MPPVDIAPSPTQRRVLTAVKRRGEATADELAATLEISPSAVRQHLSMLRAAGLVEARRERGQPGRPADRYRTTERAESLFVPATDDLSIELLELIDAEDPALVQRVFDQRRARLVADARDHLDAATAQDRIERVTELLDAQGYLCDWEQLTDGHYRINLHNCAVWNVASRFRQACASELEFLRDILPDATVSRVTHKTSGAHTCGYEVTFAH